MSKGKRLNRDHAKKTQRPMVEDRVIAEHLTTLLTPTIKSQSGFFPRIRTQRQDSNATFNGGCRPNFIVLKDTTSYMARCSRSN